MWFSQGTLLSSTNKTDCHNITEILLKVALKHHNPYLPMGKSWYLNRNLFSIPHYSTFLITKDDQLVLLPIDKKYDLVNKVFFNILSKY
jgi:hypothetical protein